jgi:hypothetical protein
LEPRGTIKGISAVGVATLSASTGAAVGTGIGYAAQSYGIDTGYNMQIGALIGSVVGAGGGLLASFFNKKKEYEGGMTTKKHRKSKRKTIKMNKNKIKKAKYTRKNKITRKQ